MYIKSISLKNFRNYEDTKILFDDHINIIYGKNAQGKTNILEAIYLCSTSKSHRTSNIKELILFHQEEAHITVEIVKDNQIKLIDVHLRKNNKKSIAINKVSIRKLNELFGVMKIIMFSPEDLGLIKNGPKERRRFIDLELCQINPIYYHHLKSYYLVLKQRNNLLKTIKKNSSYMDQLEVWDLQLVEYGKHIMKHRQIFIDELNPYFQSNHYKISGECENSNIFYERNVEIDQFEKKLFKNIQYDISIGSTSVGPHKDDLKFEINGIDIRKYGSQGQQRTAALSLKLSEIELIKTLGEDNPILLLDDVLSELDEMRQSYLIENIKDIQTIITCTGIEDFINSKIKIENMIKIENGSWVQ
ncbi:MAG: DNA replication/repair protein RecF [Firmicutes bacterium HGW-Firmicutes-1]|jgi:DNA replication and repair protein RecF|nr:MAG: DNA replication/repair protein RecF [Firmicutes bacterium HGW-Firmicutes-1]